MIFASPKSVPSRSTLVSDRGPVPPHVLLITENPDWMEPVRQAVAAAGGVLESLPARAAVARLSGITEPVSHVLADAADRDGLLDTLAALTVDCAGASVALFYLGPPAIAHGRAHVIPAADRQSVTGSLALQHPRRARAEPPLTTIDLTDVIAGGLIVTRYQPIVRMADRGVAAVEVLARLNHPAHGSVTPDWFVPRFERSGLAFSLTDLVSTRAFDDQAGPAFRALGVPMALNYPLTVLSHPDAARTLDDKRTAAGLTVDQVTIELTESRPVEDFAALGRSMEDLRALGYRISIDDAGPRVKNLERLLTLPFTGLKLDKGIVRAIGSGGPLASHAPRIAGQALARGLTIVGEGVETMETWDQLCGIGVQEAQGYLIARPLPAKAVPVWLEAWAGAKPEVRAY